MDAALSSDILSKSHLFRRLRETDRLALIEQAQRVSLNAGEVLYAESQSAQSLYVITQGRMRLSRKSKGRSIPYGQLCGGDYFGLECISRNPFRTHTATAEESTTLLYIGRTSLLKLAEQAPHFKANLKTAMNAQLASAPKGSAWLEPSEYLHYFGYRHAVFLVGRLFLPLLLGMASIFFITMATEMEQAGFTTVGVIGVLAALLWGAWNYFDYYNDFFVITSKRVVWQEKIIGIYDSRQEAPAHAIRVIDYDASWIGRLIGFGTVYVRTFTGGVILNRIENAQYVIDLIDEIREKTVNEKVHEERQTRRRVLSEQIGLVHPQVEQPQTKPVSQERQRAAWEISFKTRMVQGDAVIYRKHWLILISKTIIPLLSFIAAAWLALGFALSPEWESYFNPQAGFFVGALLAIAATMWAAYHYLDWRDDIYMVTSEYLYDIERHPLGREEKKSAPLESVLSLTVERKNLVGILFNFGDVVIDAGGTALIFHNVCDPASAQLDIAARLDGLKRRKDEAKTAAENRRLAEWIGEYNEMMRG